MLYSEKQFG